MKEGEPQTPRATEVDKSRPITVSKDTATQVFARILTASVSAWALFRLGCFFRPTSERQFLLVIMAAGALGGLASEIAQTIEVGSTFYRVVGRGTYGVMPALIFYSSLRASIVRATISESQQTCVLLPVAFLGSFFLTDSRRGSNKAGVFIARIAVVLLFGCLFRGIFYFLKLA